MMRKLLSLILICMSVASSWSQTFTLYQNNFEAPGDTWINSLYSGPNYWIKRDCAGNGPSFSGSQAQYITKGGVDEDCSATGKYQYAYANAVGPVEGAITQIEINASCTGLMQATFDYKIDGTAGQDYMELVYSTDGGTTFFPIGSALTPFTNWTTTTISLPPLLNNSVFRIGFRFVFNDITINGNPPAIDNFRITGADITAPDINFCGQNPSFALTANCEALINDLTSAVVASDNCTSVSNLTITQSPVPGSVTLNAPGQTQIITFSVIDQAGNISQCTVTATAVDQSLPTISCPSLPLSNLNDQCQVALPDLSTLVIWSDNCHTDPSDMTFIQTPPAGDLISADQTILITISDPYGNTASCSTDLLVVDNTDPVLTCPSDVSLSTGSNCFIELGNYLSVISVDDNCSLASNITLSQSPIPGSNLTVATPIVITGEDEAGNIGFCDFVVTPIDDQDPLIVCPPDQTATTGTGCLHNLIDMTGDVEASDNCTVLFNITLTQSPAPGTDLAIGPHTITVVGEDETGNSSTCSFTLTVADLTSPEIICPGNQNLTTDANCSAVIVSYAGLAAVSDDCSLASQISISQSPVPGTPISSNTQIILTATDEAGNTATCNFFAITVDDIDPVLSCPTELSVAINSSCQMVVPDLSGEITGSDNCSSIADMSLTQNPSDGSLEIGLTAVLLTLTDEQGNQGTCLTLLVPDDTETPVITCPTPATINNGTTCDFTLPNYAALTLVLDNCSGFTITQNPPAGSVIQAGTHVIEMEVSDVAGNLASCSFDLTVIETVAPTITCPNNITTCDPVVTYGAPAVVDNCSATLTQIDATGLSSGDTFPVGTTIQEYQVEDPSGNSNTCTFNVTVLDYPAQATIIEDTIGLCNATSTVISAQTHTTGTGLWTVSEGTGNFNNQYATTTGVNNLTYGTNILVYTISTVSCGSTSDSVYVIASQAPLPASTQDSLNACYSSQISLQSNTPLYGTGVWTTDDPSAVIADVNSSNTTATGMSAGYFNYIWTITNGACPSTSDTMIVYTPAQAAIDQSDTAFCLEDISLNLSATAPAPVQTSYWMFIQGGGSFGTPGSSSTTVSELDLGTNLIVYTMEHPNCASTSDTIIIVASLCEGFNPVFPTVITPNLDGKNDLFVINYLEKVYPECRVIIFNRWGSVVYESVGYQEPWDGTYKGEALPMGTYFYRIELNDEENTVYDGPISIIK